MNTNTLKSTLINVRDGNTTIENAIDAINALPYDIVEDYARLDTEREARTGASEVVYSQGKTASQVAEIIATMVERSSRALATRATMQHFEAVRVKLPEAEFHERAGLITVGSFLEPTFPDKYVAVLSAGTADESVAEEASLTLEWLGVRVERLYDVGVAGIHRLFAHLPVIRNAMAVVVVAGMDGALPSVVAGLVSPPIVAVPTSIGYGASFGGVAALLSMLNSCAGGVAVVNIDNGFGAGCYAHRIVLGTMACSCHSQLSTVGRTNC